MTSQAIPKSLNLSSNKPTTIPAYSRRVESIATNAQTFGPNSIANIVLDTSTPGSFLDPTQSLLQFDLEITNTNPFIDYINLSSCGLGALIQEMRIICQGTPIEEILDYNLMFEMFMDLGGHAQEEFKMYVENSWRAPVHAGYNDLNFVKPPMVDREGVIMCPNNINMFGDSSSCVHNENGIQFGVTNPIPAGSLAGLNMTYYPDPTLGQGQNYNVAAANGFAANSRHKPTARAWNVANNVAPLPTPGAGLSCGSNYANFWSPTDAKWTGCNSTGNVRAQTWTNRLDNTYVTWPSTLRPEPISKSEIRQRMEGDTKKYRIQDYLQFLANVKNIPVGISPSRSYINNELATTDAGQTVLANWNFAAIVQNAAPSAKINFSVSLPIFSGVLGVWAEKHFPTMLISPGSFYFQLKFANATQAFQCAMDPCRRINGTHRDYVPNAGHQHFYETEYRGQVLDATKMSTIAATDGIVGANMFMALTQAGTTGNDFAWKSILAMQAPAAVGAGNAITATANGFHLNLKEQTQLAATNSNGAGLFGHSYGQGEGYSTGNAKPQYVPRLKPWTSGGNGFSDPAVRPSLSVAEQANLLAATNDFAYCRERNSCFGTHLPASTAQVRRTQTTTNTAITDAVNANTVPTYVISNLKYVGQQVILPDEVTASIVRSAAHSDISLLAQSVRTYKSQMATSGNQNLILPIKVASANSLWLVFQNSTMIENSYYLGCTRTCPLTSYTHNIDVGHFVGSDTAPLIQTVNTITPFNIQLRIGNELFPQQPITNVSMLLTELQRSVHSLADMDLILPFYSSMRTLRTTDNINPKLISGTEYTSLKSGDFLVPFIPVEALDDQTITNNQAFMDYTNMDWTAFNDRGKYVMNEYLPPVSKFLLGFDLDTFPNATETARSGRYLGNAPLTLQMTNTAGAQNPALSTKAASTVNVTAMVLHDIRFSIMAGGQVLAYY